MVLDRSVFVGVVTKYVDSKGELFSEDILMLIISLKASNEITKRFYVEKKFVDRNLVQYFGDMKNTLISSENKPTLCIDICNEILRVRRFIR